MTRRNRSTASESSFGAKPQQSEKFLGTKSVTKALVKAHQEAIPGLGSSVREYNPFYFPWLALAKAFRSHLPMPAGRDADDLVSEFWDECRKGKRLFGDAARKCRDAPLNGRLSLVEEGTRCLDDLANWVEANVRGPIDLRIWRQLSGTLVSLYERMYTLDEMAVGIAADRWRDLDKKIAALDGPPGTIYKEVLSLMNHAMESESGALSIDQRLQDHSTGEAGKADHSGEGSQPSKGNGGADDNILEEGSGYWTITFQGKELPPIRGQERFVYLAKILTRPNEWISAIQIAEDVSENARKGTLVERADEGDAVAESDSSLKSAIRYKNKDDVADRMYLKSINDKLCDLRGELDRAKADGDFARENAVQVEIDSILEQSKSLTGSGGRLRKAQDEVDRAYATARKAIERAKDAIKPHNEALWQHLKNSIHSEKPNISYRPEGDVTWSWVRPTPPTA